MIRHTHRLLRFAALLLLLIVLAFAGIARWQASRARRQSAAALSSEQQLRFTLRQLDARANSPFEPISAPAVFTSAAQFQDHMFLAGPAGLFEYDAAGKLLASYRVGFELPAAPLAELKVSAVDGTPELLIATHGEGLLIFDGRAFRQVRPELRDCRTVTALLPLPTGRILLGTAKQGLLVYDGRSLASFHPSLSGLHITAVAGDASDLWVGTLDRGVFHWHAGQADQFNEAEGLPDSQVLAITATADTAYVGTPNGIAEFTSGKLSRRLADGLFARSLLLSGQTLLAGTMDEGTWEIPLAGSRPASPRSRGQPFSVPVEQLFAGDDALYAVARNGLYRMTPSRQSWARVLSGETEVGS